MMHAVFLLVFMLALAPLMKFVPLAALAAVLLVVAWNMSEVEQFRHTLSAPKGDGLVLLLTFGLTVFFDLTVAIEVGLVASAFVFMFRMADAMEVSTGIKLLDDNGEIGDDLSQRTKLPPGVEVFQISGPLFFGTANRLDELLDQFQNRPKAFILRMRLVPIIDASGVHALKTLLERCRRLGIVLIISGLQTQPQRVIRQMAVHPREGELYFADHYEQALDIARQL